MQSNNHARLGKLALALSLGTVWGLSVFFMGVLAKYSDYGQNFVEALGTLYLGYQSTFMGSLMGALWGFVDAFFAGFFVAFFYNCYLTCCCPFHKKD